MIMIGNFDEIMFSIFFAGSVILILAKTLTHLKIKYGKSSDKLVARQKYYAELYTVAYCLVLIIWFLLRAFDIIVEPK